jgi:hypothetical protein
MAMIQIQIRNNFIEDVPLEGGSRINILIKNLRMQLSLLKPIPTPYN